MERPGVPMNTMELFLPSRAQPCRDPVRSRWSDQSKCGSFTGNWHKRAKKQFHVNLTRLSEELNNAFKHGPVSHTK